MLTLQDRRNQLKREVEARRKLRVSANAIIKPGLTSLGDGNVVPTQIIMPVTPTGTVFTPTKYGEIYEDTLLLQYEKHRPTLKERRELGKYGFIPLTSSNVSAIATQEDSLLVRFLNESVYRYPGKANLFDAFATALSPGRFVWNFLRRTNAKYEFLGKLSI